ncbi:unnamed protein product [Adineta steineri]|uniref:F-box domain-containing protein n=2 Tax=Adineta steineri TaxID=433720 RepID=A0A815CXA0_9BILA|nr:unnamed protein product [Adineta steineri]
MSTHTHFLHLPNELIYRCFNYLSFDEILQSFVNLNIRFSYLITTHWRSIQIGIDVRKSQFERLLHNLNPIQVRSLHLLFEDDERHYSNQFLSLFPIEKFKNLHFLKLNDSSQQSFHSLLTNLHQLHQLSKLIILDNSSEDDELIFTQIFLNRIPTLKSVTLDFTLHYQPTTTSNNYNYSFSNIQVLKLTGYLDNIHRFLERTPRLTKLILTLHEFFDNNEQQTNKNMFLHIPSTLTYLQINFSGTSNFFHMDTVTELFKLNSSSLLQLQHLVMIGEVHDTLLDGKGWQQIIEHYLPSLELFQFYFDATNDNNWNYIEYHRGDWIITDFDSIMNSFKTDFWLHKHQWYVYGETNDETTVINTLPLCTSSSLYLRTSLPVNTGYRAQITSPVVPYTHQYENTIQELTLCINPDADSSQKFYDYYFSNIIKLCLDTDSKLQNIVESLSNVINLNNVQQLELTHPLQSNSMGLSELLPHLPNLTTLNVYYGMTNDFTFLNTIKNKSLFAHLEIRVLTKLDFLKILEILQTNPYSLILKIRVDNEEFEDRSRQVIVNWLKEQTHLTSRDEVLTVSFNVLNMEKLNSWITIECVNIRDKSSGRKGGCGCEAREKGHTPNTDYESHI